MERASAADCRSVLLPVMAMQPRRAFRTGELAMMLEGSPLHLGRRSDQLVFEALRKAQYRGWVVKVGPSRYRFGTMPRTTMQRIVRWRKAIDLGLDGPQRSAYASWRRHTKHGQPLPLRTRSA